MCGAAGSDLLGSMATSEAKRGKGYTAPKGRPTVHRTGGGSSRRMSSKVEWGLAILVLVVVIGVVFYFGRNFRTAGGGAHVDLPGGAPIVLIESPIT